MKADPDISKVDFDVNKIMSKSNQVVYINTTHPILESLHCTIKNNKFAKCAPPSTEIASDIAICVKALQWVKSTLLYCPSAAHLLTQAILINAHRLHKMSSVETDVSIDMDDEHYKVDPSSIPDLLQVPPMKAFKSADGTNMHMEKLPTSVRRRTILPITVPPNTKRLKKPQSKQTKGVMVMTRKRKRKKIACWKRKTIACWKRKGIAHWMRKGIAHWKRKGMWKGKGNGNGKRKMLNFTI